MEIGYVVKDAKNWEMYRGLCTIEGCWRRHDERLNSLMDLTRGILDFFKGLHYYLNMPFDLDGSPNVSNKSIRTD